MSETDSRTENGSLSTSKSGQETPRTPYEAAESFGLSSSSPSTDALSSSLNLLPPPDDDDVERERETTIILHLSVFGKAKHVRDLGIRTKRELDAVGITPVRVLQDIGPDSTNIVVEDDFSDDKGEMWHTLDWTVEDPEDEGLHPDIT